MATMARGEIWDALARLAVVLEARGQLKKFDQRKGRAIEFQHNRNILPNTWNSFITWGDSHRKSEWEFKIPKVRDVDDYDTLLSHVDLTHILGIRRDTSKTCSLMMEAVRRDIHNEVGNIRVWYNPDYNKGGGGLAFRDRRHTVAEGNKAYVCDQLDRIFRRS